MVDSVKHVVQLGNSHSDAIAKALAGFRSEGVAISSYPMFHKWRLAACPAKCRRHAIVVETLDHTEASISIDNFDLFIVSAAGWWACRNEHLLRNGPTHPLAFVRCAHWGTPATKAADDLQIVSCAAFDDMVCAWIARHRMSELVRFLALEADKKVIWVSWPVPSRSLVSDQNWLLRVWYGERMPTVWRDFRASEQRAVRRLTAEYGDNVVLLPTPHPEMEMEGFMDEALASDDPFHGNINYGGLVVEQLVPFLTR